MQVRMIRETDADAFYRMQCALDDETKFMLYEPGERVKTTANSDFVAARIQDALRCKDLILVAESDAGEIVGFLWAERGKLNRISHQAYIVTGIRLAFRNQGIGTAFFEQLVDWAMEHSVSRLELTVICKNVAAISLYQKFGFEIEGLKRKSVLVDGEFLDEYYMAKLLDKHKTDLE